MDIFMQSYKDSNQEPIWDFTMDFVKGEFKYLHSEAEVKQRAVLVTFIQKGTVPQLPDFGVDWTGMLTNEVLPSEINSTILKQLQECANTYGYIPDYTIVEGKLVVSVKEV